MTEATTQAATKPRGVSISPSSMVDSAADWPLHRVVERLRQKEKEERPAINGVHCRSSIRAFVVLVDELASRYKVSRSRMSCWLAYHGLVFAREDAVITKLVSAQAEVRRASLLVDDTDTIDMMNSLIPYSPRGLESIDIQLPLYDWVASEFGDLARACGVHRCQIVQIYQSKSLLSDDVDAIAGAAARLVAEVSRWDLWMGFRLGALERLVREPEDGSEDAKSGRVAL